MGKSLLFIFLFTLAISGYMIAQPTEGGEEGSSFAEKELTEVSTKVELYPNPTTEFLYVKLGGKELENVEFEVYSIIGKAMKLEIEQVSQNKFKVPVRTLSQGYYFLIVHDKNVQYRKTYKFQKK